VNRRAFLGAGASVPLVVWAVACGGGDAEPDANFQNSFQTDSETNTSGHRHTLTVRCDDFGGATVLLTTSEAAEHTHMVSLTGADFTALGGGQSVTKTITDQGHSHTWILMKPTTAC
jgi:hypothetical protein